jgi:hypothetical protein
MFVLVLVAGCQGHPAFALGYWNAMTTYAQAQVTLRG